MKADANQNKKIVISGGPGSGKSTLLRLLEADGYQCFKEFSRDLIKREKKGGNFNYFKSNPIEFSSLVWEKRVDQLNAADKLECNVAKPYVFFDRGLHDVIAYLNYIGEAYDSDDFNLNSHHYELALLLPPWKAIYVNDGERMESFEEATALYYEIKRTYKEYKIPMVEIPIGTPDQRVLTILELLKNGK